jgi:hypothetical protein
MRTAMTDGIGRILVASLHQSIGDVLPMRLEYYEHWLTPTGMREGRTGLAPLGAVLSFLRLEGMEPYDRVMTQAGEYSADWAHAEHRVPSRLVLALPRRLRLQVALRRARQLTRAAFEKSRATARVRRDAATLDIRDSIFCGMREAWPWPTCRYFAAAARRQLQLLDLDGEVAIEQCRAMGAQTCRLRLSRNGGGA